MDGLFTISLPYSLCLPPLIIWLPLACERWLGIVGEVRERKYTLLDFSIVIWHLMMCHVLEFKHFLPRIFSFVNEWDNSFPLGIFQCLPILLSEI